MREFESGSAPLPARSALSWRCCSLRHKIRLGAALARRWPDWERLRLQAIARSHRIGQTKEVRVIHLEAVADAEEGAASASGEVPQMPWGLLGVPWLLRNLMRCRSTCSMRLVNDICQMLPWFQQACCTGRGEWSVQPHAHRCRQACTLHLRLLCTKRCPAPLTRACPGACQGESAVRVHARRAQARYADSIESLVRNNIQKIKTDMANEVIDAGRFDMETTMAERKDTLESMLQACALPVSSSIFCGALLLPPEAGPHECWLGSAAWTARRTLSEVLKKVVRAASPASHSMS